MNFSNVDRKPRFYKGLSARDWITISLVAGCGVYSMWEGLSLDLGSVRRIGAGAFPFAIGALLSIMAIFLGLAGSPANSTDQPKISIRGPVHISAAMIAFMILINPLGLAPTIAIVTILSASADRSLRLRSVLLLALFASSLCTVVFVFLLGLPLQPFWW
ncbi:MAG: tripartite tricarboxylate transporter TctB family protein [Rhizobiaceae bacterium]|nr:tripartite tricarboxylate transporter TctB family protein [Rhizobiaceae bacterium]